MEKTTEKKKYFVVRERAVPEVLLKVVQAKRLLDSGRAQTVLDAAEQHKNLEDYFIYEKIPATHRDEQLLLAGEDEIFWIVGGRMAYGTGISDATRWVLEITASNSSH